MNTRFYGGKILTMANGEDWQTGELWVKDDCVAYVGPGKASDIHFDREIDLKGDLLLPGFKNAHTHSAMTFLRSYADDLPLLDWLNKMVFPMEAKLKVGEIHDLSKLAILEYLTSGITANFDMYMKTEEIAAASAEMGFRTVMCGSINNYGGTVQEIEEEYKRFNSYDPLISYKMGFHAEYTCTEKLMRDLAELAGKYGTSMSVHNSETADEVAGCIERYGMTPTAYLDSIGMFDNGGTCFHCVHMTDEDMDIFVRRGIFAVTNPASNTKLASGIAPLTHMLEKGIPIGIGTDGPASNNCLDMFREMFLAAGLQKLLANDAAAMPAKNVLRMATTDGARAMGLYDCDCLAPGKKADLTVIDLHRPNMQPENNIVKNLVYSGSKENVRLTMVGGRILYENGEFFTGCDPEEIYARANAIIAAKR